jgi:hypothetical protein
MKNNAITEDRTVCFGLYRMNPDDVESEFPKGYLNVHNVGVTPGTLDAALSEIRTVTHFGGKVWLCVWNAVFAPGNPVPLQRDWQANLSAIVDRLEKEDVTGSVLGFYFDEPLLCGVPKETYRKLTKFMRETWPSLRVFTVFAVNAVDPTVWSAGNDQVLDPETLRYTTDAGYDMYHDARGDGILPYKKLNASLKERFGRDDFHVWYVPCIMNYWGNKDEAYALAHTEAMYGFLKEEKNPGGMLCYAWDISNHDGEIGNIGLNELLVRDKDPWTALYDRVQKIGREILGCRGKAARRTGTL